MGEGLFIDLPHTLKSGGVSSSSLLARGLALMVGCGHHSGIQHYERMHRRRMAHTCVSIP